MDPEAGIGLPGGVKQTNVTARMHDVNPGYPRPGDLEYALAMRRGDRGEEVKDEPDWLAARYVREECAPLRPVDPQVYDFVVLRRATASGQDSSRAARRLGALPADTGWLIYAAGRCCCLPFPDIGMLDEARCGQRK